MGDFKLVPEQHHLGAIHRSCTQSQETILLSIIELHNNGKPFHVDACFNRGKMYGDSVPLPEVRMDKDPVHCVNGVIEGDFMQMPFDDGSIRSIILDPPFIIGKDNQMMSERYGCYKTLDELQRVFIRIVEECSRVLQKDGLFVFKCQDIIQNRKKFFASLFIMNVAYQAGFMPVDEYIKVNKTRPTQGTKQIYASRSYHSKFIVFNHRRGKRVYIPEA